QNAVKDLMHMGSDLPYQVQTFVEMYLRGLRRSDEIQVKHVEYTLGDMIFHGTSGKPPKVTLTNPTTALADLFRQVMRTGNPHLPVPINAIEGLANGGHGFYTTSWFERPHMHWLTAHLSQFPGHLVRQTADGWRWLREPESKHDQFLHCLFHLRMTMAFLAENPLGKAKAGKKDEIAHALSQLPVRCAYVQASDGVWYMRTLDTTPAVDRENLKARLHFIREQTRQTYCHPRSEV